MSRSLVVLVAFLLFGAGSCQDVMAPQPNFRRIAGAAPSRNMQPIVDWFTCWSWDQGQTWDCIYTGTTGNDGTPDHWDPYDNFHTTRDCSIMASYCDLEFQPGGNSPYDEPRETGRAEEADNLVESVPSCPQPKNARATLKAYCAGRAPTSTQMQLMRDAVDRMRQLGGICATLASIGDAILNRAGSGSIRVYPQGSYKFGAAAPQGGGASGAHSWLIISQDYMGYHGGRYGWVKNSNTANPAIYYKNTLQGQLVHELDHLNDAHHIVENGVENTAITTNMRACSDIDMGPGAPRPK